MIGKDCKFIKLFSVSLPPYQLGLWLNKYLRSTCALCLTPFFVNQLKEGICKFCHQDIRWLPKPFVIDLDTTLRLSIHSATVYENCTRQAMIGCKYREDLSALPLLVHAIRQLPRPRSCHSDNSVILPMPTTNNRLKHRGFDPVLILARYLSKHWQIPIWQGAKRIHDVARQQGLNKEDRLLNVQGAFVLKQVPPTRHVILFDDVATTGASLCALAKPFIDSGYLVYLSAYTIAHGNSR